MVPLLLKPSTRCQQSSVMTKSAKIMQCGLSAYTTCNNFICCLMRPTLRVQSPFLFAYRLDGYPGKLVCAGDWNGEYSHFAKYTLAIFIVFLYTPLVLITVLYSIIVWKLKSQPTPGEHSVNAAQQREKRKRKMLKMVIAIVLSFTVCWVPFTIFTLLGKVSCSTLHYYASTLIIARANCAINPCICLIFSQNYSRGLKSLLTKCSCCVTLQTNNQVAQIAL